MILWHGVALHCMEWRGIIPYGVAWHGGQDVAWYGTRLHCTGCMAFLCMSWCGIAWHGLAVLIVHTHCCWDSRFGVLPRRAITLFHMYFVFRLVFVFSYLVVFVFVLQRMCFSSLSDLSSNFPPGKPSINFLDHMYRYCIIIVQAHVQKERKNM